MEWPDTRLGLLSPRDPRFPLPGTAGPDPSLLKSKEEAKASPAEPDVLTEPTSAERQGEVLQQYLEMAEKVSRGMEALHAGGLRSRYHYYYDAVHPCGIPVRMMKLLCTAEILIVQWLCLPESEPRGGYGICGI